MVLSCIVGVVIRTLLGTIVVIAAPIAVALAVVAMQMTATIHRESLPSTSLLHSSCCPLLSCALGMQCCLNAAYLCISRMLVQRPAAQRRSS
jgi:hypothetical protein